MAIPSFGSAPTPDATASVKGKLRLTGDLAGTAASPALAAIVAGATVGSSTLIPVVTYDTKGRITGTTTAAISATGASETFAFFQGN